MKELETNSRAVLVGIRNALGLPALLLFSAMTGFGSFAHEHGFSLCSKRHGNRTFYDCII